MPCCVDARGADPVPENDSDGEYILLVAQLHRYAGDRAAARSDWPRGARRRRLHRRLRQRSGRRRTGPARQPRLLRPAAALDQPRRLFRQAEAQLLGRFLGAGRATQDAAWLAGELGKPGGGAPARRPRDEFRGDILASIAAARAIHGIAYHPRRGRPRRFRRHLDDRSRSPRRGAGAPARGRAARTFERYWREFRRAGTAATPGTTTRRTNGATIGSFVRLGWRERARTRWPISSWPTGARRAGTSGPKWSAATPREPRFIGDMPHGWVASDFIRCRARHVRLRAAAATGALVLGGGLSADWLSGGGIAVRRLRTSYGAAELRPPLGGARGSLRCVLGGAGAAGRPRLRRSIRASPPLPLNGLMAGASGMHAAAPSRMRRRPPG